MYLANIKNIGRDWDKKSQEIAATQKMPEKWNDF